MQTGLFEDEDAAYALVESRVWPNGPVCPHCGSARAGRLCGKTTRPGLHKCYACRKPFTVKSRTLFEGSHIPLNRWLKALFLFKASNGQVTAEQLHRELGVTCKTAYFIIERISDAARSQRFPDVIPTTPWRHLAPAYAAARSAKSVTGGDSTRGIGAA
jgi:transposase-like protein